MNRSDIIELYRSKAEKYSLKHRSLVKRLNILSLLRLLIFISGVVASALLFSQSTTAGIITVIISLFLFVRIIIKYSETEWQRDYFASLVRINEDEIKAMEGDSSSFNPGNEYINIAHDFSHDIDLFGNNSLFQYLNRTFSDSGRERLACWLGNPVSVAGKYRERGAAIKELGDDVDWRQRFTALGTMKPAGKEERERLNQWLSESPIFRNEKMVKGVIIVFPALTVLFLVLGITGNLSFSFFIVSYLVNLLLISLKLRQANRVHGLVSKQYDSLTTMKAVIEHFTSRKVESPCLADLQDSLKGQDTGAIEAMDKLAGIIKLFDTRLNMVAGVLMNGLFLLDLVSLVRLENWKRRVKELVPGWFDDLGAIDALVSLSNYAYNNPGYCYPLESDSEIFLDAREMGHPLIMNTQRVVNDFRVNHHGEINIITGANMAGKSTFLRTLAVNMILAMTGAPVCASVFIFTRVNIFSSMRTSDSLSGNESYFYAELKRLKRLKERSEKGEPLFFILDEILKGTNSKDKSEGSKMFVEKIIVYRATGIIATHDTSLGELEKSYPGTVRNSCFEISITEDKVLFDYKLQPGITTRMNAALLMRQQGIID